MFSALSAELAQPAKAGYPGFENHLVSDATPSRGSGGLGSSCNASNIANTCEDGFGRISLDSVPLEVVVLEWEWFPRLDQQMPLGGSSDYLWARHLFHASNVGVI